MKYEDVKLEDSTYEISLTKLTGKKIKDISGYVSDEWGDPFFQISRVIFEDDYSTRVEGEHDCPYIYSQYKIPNLDEDTLYDIMKTDPDYEPDTDRQT